MTQYRNDSYLFYFYLTSYHGYLLFHRKIQSYSIIYFPKVF